MALLDGSSGLWTVLGQASNVVSMVVQAALAAPRRVPAAGAARGDRRRPAAGARARGADAAGGHAAAARAAPGHAAAALRARHGVPGLRVPPQPARRRPDGRRAPLRRERYRHAHPSYTAHRARRHYS
jgi:hypothetical protein